MKDSNVAAVGGGTDITGGACQPVLAVHSTTTPLAVLAVLSLPLAQQRVVDGQEMP
jgi:hypothetical protein